MTEDRKIRKPLMEKKRRARINESLEILKNIMLECDPETASRSNHKSAKLEKADILEMTVSYLQKLRARQKQCISYPYGIVPNPTMLQYKPKPYQEPVVPNQLIYHPPPIKMISQQPGVLSYPVQNYRLNNNSHIPLPSVPVDVKNTYKYVPKMELVSPPTSPEVRCDKVTSSSHEEIDVEGDVWRPW